MLVLPATVKWRMKGRIFFRRLFGCASVAKCQGGYLVKKKNGARAIIPADGTEVIAGKSVQDLTNA